MMKEHADNDQQPQIVTKDNSEKITRQNTQNKLNWKWNEEDNLGGATQKLIIMRAKFTFVAYHKND